MFLKLDWMEAAARLLLGSTGAGAGDFAAVRSEGLSADRLLSSQLDFDRRSFFANVVGSNLGEAEELSRSVEPSVGFLSNRRELLSL